MTSEEQALQNRLARHYDLPRQVSAFFALLILSECTTPESIVNSMGEVEVRGLAYHLRKKLRTREPAVEVRSRHSIGYWLDDDTRRTLAKRFGVELGITTERIAT